MRPGAEMKSFQSMVATISRSPKLSVLLVAYNMPRELSRTLLISCSAISKESTKTITK